MTVTARSVPARLRPAHPGWGRPPRPGRSTASLALAALLAVALVVGVAACGGDDGDDDDPGGAAREAEGSESAPADTTTTMRTGGIEVEAPDGWQAIPVAQLGFGVAVPPGWEATILSEEVLTALERSSPEVPGFLDSARHAARAGAVFYAAGQDRAGRVSDLKVRAAPETGITDAAGLERYAQDLVAEAGDELGGGVSIEVVDGEAAAGRPTVRIRYRVSGLPGRGEDVVAEGTETLTVGPRGIVWSVIVTSEDPDSHDELAARITGTLAFAPE